DKDGAAIDSVAKLRKRHELQAERAEEGAGARGPMEQARVDQRLVAAVARKKKKAGGRPEEEESRRAQRQELQAERAEAEQRGYPFPDEEALSPEQIQERKGTATAEMLCRNCREKNTKFLLPVLPPIPEALQQLQPIEQHLIAMARISQILLDKLPAGGPSAQWGRMYAVLVDDPFICDVLEGATLEEDGTVL
ncbi:unnamed protein product, partial [Symbiodinium sp. KB8]